MPEKRAPEGLNSRKSQFRLVRKTVAGQPGAIGMLQFMPATAQRYGVDPAIPEENIDGGARYLRALMDRFKNRRNPLTRVIAAHNADPTKVDRHHGIPPFRETQRDVVRVLGFWPRFQNDYAKVGRASDVAAE